MRRTKLMILICVPAMGNKRWSGRLRDMWRNACGGGYCVRAGAKAGLLAIDILVSRITHISRSAFDAEYANTSCNLSTKNPLIMKFLDPRWLLNLATVGPAKIISMYAP